MTPSPVAPIVNSGIYPIPVIIPFADLGFKGATAEQAKLLFTSVGAGKDLPWRYRYVGNMPDKQDVYPVVAFKVAQRMRFGNKAESREWREIWGTLQDRFFPGVQFFGEHGRVNPVEVRLRKKKPFPDGDTARVEAFRRGNDWVGTDDATSGLLLDGDWLEFSSSVRMDGVDTPESWERSGKFARHRDGVTAYLQKAFAVSDEHLEDLRQLVAARIVYLGKVAGAVTYGFGDHFADVGIRLAPAYTLTNKEGLNDTLDIWDKYGRLIGRIMSGGDNQGEDLLAGFIETVLPQYMKMAKDVHVKAYHERIAPYRETLEHWMGDSRMAVLYEALGPISSKKYPTKIFSKPTCGKLARIWKDFVARHPEAANDVQTMSALIGTAPPYPKYPGHLLPMDLSAELYALGGVRSVSRGHGLTGDLVFQLLRPSAYANDPYRSLAYGEPDIGTTMADLEKIEDMDPAGVHAEFLKRHFG